MAGIMYTAKVFTPIWEATNYNYYCDQDCNLTVGVVYSGLPFCSMFRLTVEFRQFQRVAGVFTWSQAILKLRALLQLATNTTIVIATTHFTFTLKYMQMTLEKMI